MPWLTASEVADRYRITISGLSKQRTEGRTPGALGKRVGKRVLWASEELDAFDGQGHPFGAMDALVLEVRGINKRLDKLIDEFRRSRLTDLTYTEIATMYDEMRSGEDE